jgi:preprotein translocase subunit SecD
MFHFPLWKKILVSFICLLAIWFTIPNFLSASLREKNTWLSSALVPLGLDLQGGSYVLLEIQSDHYMREQLEQIATSIRTGLRTQKNGDKPITYQQLQLESEQIKLLLNDERDALAVREYIKKLSASLDVKQDGTLLRLSFSDDVKKQMSRDLMEQSLEIVRRRVDETGTRESDIVRQGDRRILVQVPGFNDPERLKALLGKTAKLTFHLLDESITYSQSPYAPTSAQAMRLPGNTPEKDGQILYYAVQRQVMLGGEMLVDARSNFHEQDSVVQFRFNDVGAKKFAEITQRYVGKPFAIVLDQKVISAPVIREPILGGSGVISGNFTPESAKDLAVLLRAGALPAPLAVVEERTIGPSLGQDSIADGARAAILGVAFVTIFMFIGYGKFGMFANLALIMNLLIIIAVMSIISATLTLPGIAGVVLTMGMAVDANVLIYERMREEIANGKTALAAIENGFAKAFNTIFDSNITTLIAAAMLFFFGSGPVKGFAITLAVGISASMFTAVLLTRWMVVSWVKRNRPNKLPI